MNREPSLFQVPSNASPKKTAILPAIRHRAAAVAMAALALAGCNRPGHWVFPDTNDGVVAHDASSDTSGSAVDAGGAPDGDEAYADAPDSIDFSDVVTSDTGVILGDSLEQEVSFQDAVSQDVQMDALQAIDASFDATETAGKLSIPWGTAVWDGYGKVTWDPDLNQLRMIPQVATQPKETHSCLVVSNQAYSQPYQFSFTMKTIKQLRENSPPNPWEVGWAVFGYKNTGADAGKFKYAIFKPNGLEIGESLLNDIQNDLFTSVVGQTDFPINTDYNVVISVANNVVTVTVNGAEIKKYTMDSADVLTADGLVGVYNEDSEVVVSNFKAEQL